MTIACKICGHKMHSQFPADKAQRHVLEQMTNHLGQRHQAEAQDLATIIAATSTYLLMRRYVEIPAQETELRESFQRNEVNLFEILELPAFEGDSVPFGTPGI